MNMNTHSHTHTHTSTAIHIDTNTMICFRIYTNMDIKNNIRVDIQRQGMKRLHGHVYGR